MTARLIMQFEATESRPAPASVEGERKTPAVSDGMSLEGGNYPSYVDADGRVYNTAQMAERIRAIRTGLPSRTLRREGNAAVAYIDIESAPKEMAAHSRVSKAGNGLVGDGKQNFVAQKLPDNDSKLVDRRIDSE